MPARIEGPARPASRASTLACVGACGYLIGLALPLPPPFDLIPLPFLVLAAVVAAVMGGKRLNRRLSLALIPALGFVLARLLSSLSGPHVARGLQFLAPFLPALLLFFILSEWIETRHQITVIYVSLTLTGFVLATTLLLTSMSGDNADGDAWARATSTPMLAIKNDITVVAVLAPVALAIAFLRLHRLIPLLTVGFFASLLAVIVLVRSRTALLTAVVGIACFTALAGRKTFASHKRLVLLVLGAIVAIAFAIDAYLGFPFVHKLTHDSHGSGRLALWSAALAMLRDAPVLGHGPGSFVLEFRTYLDALQAPTATGSDSRVTPWAHNLYLELLAEQGAVGFVWFLALSAMGVTMLIQTLRGRDSDIRFLGAGAGAAFIAFLVAAFFELSFIRVWVPIALLTLFGLLSMLSRIKNRGVSAPAK